MKRSYCFVATVFLAAVCCAQGWGGDGWGMSGGSSTPVNPIVVVDYVSRESMYVPEKYIMVKPSEKQLKWFFRNEISKRYMRIVLGDRVMLLPAMSSGEYYDKFELAPNGSLRYSGVGEENIQRCASSVLEYLQENYSKIKNTRDKLWKQEGVCRKRFKAATPQMSISVPGKDYGYPVVYFEGVSSSWGRSSFSEGPYLLDTQMELDPAKTYEYFMLDTKQSMDTTPNTRMKIWKTLTSKKDFEMLPKNLIDLSNKEIVARRELESAKKDPATCVKLLQRISYDDFKKEYECGKVFVVGMPPKRTPCGVCNGLGIDSSEYQALLSQALSREQSHGDLAASNGYVKRRVMQQLIRQKRFCKCCKGSKVNYRITLVQIRKDEPQKRTQQSDDLTNGEIPFLP